MSFCQRIRNYGTHAYNYGCAAYRKAEACVMTLPYGIGRAVQCLKASVSAIPIARKKIDEAGKSQAAVRWNGAFWGGDETIAVQSAIKGVNITFGVIAGSGFVVEDPTGTCQTLALGIITGSLVSLYHAGGVRGPVRELELGSLGLTCVALTPFIASGSLITILSIGVSTAALGALAYYYDVEGNRYARCT